jgi:hypothetical protein
VQWHLLDSLLVALCSSKHDCGCCLCATRLQSPLLLLLHSNIASCRTVGLLVVRTSLRVLDTGRTYSSSSKLVAGGVLRCLLVQQLLGVLILQVLQLHLKFLHHCVCSSRAHHLVTYRHRHMLCPWLLDHSSSNWEPCLLLQQHQVLQALQLPLLLQQSKCWCINGRWRCACSLCSSCCSQRDSCRHSCCCGCG